MCKERYINPFTDFGFKKLFGSKGSEKTLISILNAVIDEGNPITSISYLPTEKLGLGQRSRVAIFDLYCKTTDGSRIIVEMQNNSQDFFLDRSIYYSSFPIQEAAKKGQWDYRLPKIYTISFLNFTIQELTQGNVKSVVKLANIDTGEVFYDNLTYIFIELPKFNKKQRELVTPLDWWLYILKELDQFDEPPKDLLDDVMRYFFECADIKKFTIEQVHAYEDSLKALRDYQNVLDYAMRKSLAEGRAEGHAEGLAEGRSEGLAEGRAEGLARGIEEGRIKEQIKIARKLKNSGLQISEIIELTGLTPEDVKKL